MARAAQPPHDGSPVDAASRYPSLLTPISIGTLRLPHRVLMGSMHLNLETSDGGALAAFYAERARGGAGLIITGGAAVSRVGAGNAGYALINDPSHADRLRAVTDAVHAEGGLIALQLFHAGRYAFESAFGLTPVAPSAVYSAFSKAEPEALSEQGIRSTIDDFASGAARALELGFDGVEVMGSEGYLLNQFASPVTNLRDDDWGGDAERRRAFPVAVVRAVRAAVGDAPVLMRMSGADLVPDSSTQEEIDALAVAVVAAGADAIDVGVGWHESRVPTVQSMVPHGVWADAAGRVKRALTVAGSVVPVIASNRINTAAQAERILASGVADLVSMARPFLADPAILAKSFAGMAEFVNTCIGCNEACIDRTFGLEPVSCTVNPRAGRELEFPTAPLVEERRRSISKPARVGGAGFETSPRSSDSPQPAETLRIAVIGSGPAGMEAARAAAAAGARVTLFEAGPRIGGQFLLAGMVPGKEDFLQTVRYFENELARLGVEIRLGAPVDDVDALAGFDHVVVSTGVLPRPVALAGVELPHVIDYAQAFANPESVGRRVAILGAGGIAVDLAHLLVEPSPLPETAPLLEEVAQRPSRKEGSERAIHRRFLISHGLAAGTLPPPARTVTIMRRSGSIGAGMGTTVRWAAVRAIRTAGVRTLTGVAYRHIDSDGVWIEHDGGQELIEADTVIVAAGQVAHAPLADALEARGIRYSVIGGALSATALNAVAAFEQGLRVGTSIA
jgi:2,4-dienoyl-CoA reductase (NADPH2)